MTQVNTMPVKATPRKTFRIPQAHEKTLDAAVESGKFATRTAAVLHGIELVQEEMEVVE